MLLAPFLLVALALQDSCPNCLHRGVLECKKHTEISIEQERPSAENPILYCWWAANCRDCEGTLWIDCPRCQRGALTREVEARRSLIRSWMDTNALDDHMGRSVPRLESERFALVIDVPLLRNGKKKMSGHELAHLLALDLEQVAALVAGHYSMSATDYRSKMRMWLWDSLKTHQNAQQRFQKTITTGDFKMLGRGPLFSVWTEPPNFDTVPKVRALFVHNSAHMLLSNAYRPQWVGDIGGGWLDAGLGHWYEYEVFGRTVNYCLEESTLLEDYHGGEWRAAVRRRTEKEKGFLLPALLPKRTGALSAAEQALCWSFYDWLLQARPGVVRPIMAELKRKKPAREVLAEVLEMNLFETDEAWRAWVKETYPMRGDKPKKAKKKRR
jgi:hypothetical protein